MAFFSGLFAGARRYDPASRAVGDAPASGMAARFRQLQDEYERVLKWGSAAGMRSGSVVPADAPLIDLPPGMMLASSGHSHAAQSGRAGSRPVGGRQSRSSLGDVRGQAQIGVEFQPQPPVAHEITGPALKDASILAQSVARIPPGGDGRIGNSFTDPDYLLIEESVEQKLKLPAGILAAIRTRGERSNADQVSSAGARTVYQILPDTQRRFLRAYGVDAYAGPAEAARVAALHLRDSYARHRDWNLAIGEYHGGPNQRNWGQVNRDYGRRVGDFNRRR
jgi:hypothetical protein